MDVLTQVPPEFHTLTFNLWDTDEANALDGISTCENGRIYSTVLVKEEK